MEQQTAERKGYGKKWKKWLAIYVVVAGIAYAIVYFVFFFHHAGGGGY